MKQEKMSIIKAEKILAEKKLAVFTLREFSLIFNLSAGRAKYFLETYCRKGFFLRLKKGLYSLKNKLPREEEIANSLYKPSYISFEYALAKYGIMPEMIYAVTSATTKPTRVFVFNEKSYSFYKIKKQAFTGYSLLREGGHNILMAEPEKALVDYFYFVSLGKKSVNERLNTRRLKKSKVISYAKLYNRASLLALIEKYAF